MHPRLEPQVRIDNELPRFGLGLGFRFRLLLCFGVCGIRVVGGLGR